MIPIRTPAEIATAHEEAPKHRFALRGLMKVDESKATPEDMALVAKVRAVGTPEELDKALASPRVNSLFLRDVIYFGEPKS